MRVSGGLRFATVVAKQMSPGHLATCQESMRQDSNLRPLRPENAQRGVRGYQTVSENAEKSLNLLGFLDF